MIFRVTALLTDETLVEGWAKDEDHWRKKLCSKFGDRAREALLYTYGTEPHHLTHNQVTALKGAGHSDRHIKMIFDIDCDDQT